LRVVWWMVGVEVKMFWVLQVVVLALTVALVTGFLGAFVSEVFGLESVHFTVSVTASVTAAVIAAFAASRRKDRLVGRVA